MKLATVIGRVTLNRADPAFTGGRFLVCLPWSREQLLQREAIPASGNSLVVYDNLGASSGDIIAYTDGAEATMPFAAGAPCDAYNCGLIDHIFHEPPQATAS